VRSVLALIPVLSQAAAIEAAPQGECGSVQVVDAAGQPVPDARVTWWGRNPAIGPTVGFWGLTDEHGGFCGKDLRHRGFVEVEAPARKGGRCSGVTVRRWNWKPHQPPVRIVLKTSPVPLGDVSGLIRDSDGHAVAGAKVFLSRVSWKTATNVDCYTDLDIETTSGSDGAFSLGTAAHGTAMFLVQHPKYADLRFDRLLPDPLQDLVLSAGSTWSGRVLDPGGRLLDTCRVDLSLKDYLRDHPIERHSTCSGPGFSLDRLPPGAFHLRVTLERDPQLGDRLLEKDVLFQPNERRRDDIRWPAGGTIAGRVVGNDGVPIVGVSVRATPAGQNPLYDGSSAGIETTSDAGGHFVLRHLASAVPWRVSFSSNGHGWTESNLSVGVVDAVVTMPPHP
jgi:hypothetical protein